MASQENKPTIEASTEANQDNNNTQDQNTTVNVNTTTPETVVVTPQITTQVATEPPVPQVIDTTMTNPQAMDTTQMLQQIMMQMNGFQKQMSKESKENMEKLEENMEKLENRLGNKIDSNKESIKDLRVELKEDNRNLHEKLETSQRELRDELIQRIDDSQKEMVEKLEMRQLQFKAEITENVKQQRDDDKKEWEEIVEKIEVRSDKIEYHVKENAHAIADTDKNVQQLCKQVNKQLHEQNKSIEIKCTEIKEDIVIHKACLDEELSQHKTTTYAAIDELKIDIKNNIQIPHIRLPWSEHNSADKEHLPVFYGDRRLHPMKYLQNLKNHIKIVYKNEYEKFHSRIMNIIKNTIKAEAELWLRIIEDSCSNFEIFEKEFLKQFWSLQHQNKIRDKLSMGKFDSSTNDSREQYAMRIYNQAMYLEPRMQDVDIITRIAGHYNDDISLQVTIKSMDNLAVFLAYLRTIDERDAQQRRRRNTVVHNIQGNTSNNRRPYENSQDSRNNNYREQRNYNYNNNSRGRYDNSRNQGRWSQGNNNFQRDNHYGSGNRRRYSYDDTNNGYQNKNYNYNGNRSYERRQPYNTNDYTNNTNDQNNGNNRYQPRSRSEERNSSNWRNRSHTNNETGNWQRGNSNTHTQITQDTPVASNSNDQNPAPETSNSGRQDFH